ncbi:MAG: hypothetical protein AAGM22_31465, partial [Acidobacteriota bacterium]
PPAKARRGDATSARPAPWKPPTVETDTFRPQWVQPKAICTLESRAALPLLSGRFTVTVDWRGSDGVIRSASPRFDSDNSGFFVIEEPDLADWAVKILDGRFFNEHFWVFWTPLSGRESWLRVRDTHTNRERRFYSARGLSCGQAETSAFSGSAN